MKKIMIAGGTGFIGKALIEDFQDEYDIFVLSRNAAKAQLKLGSKVKTYQWDGEYSDRLADLINDSYAVINLSGEPIAAQRWTARQKETIIKSRVNGAKALSKAALKCEKPPRMFIQASAIGYYDHNIHEEMDESSVSKSNDFVNEVSREWEAGIKDLKSARIPHAIIRIGVVFGRNGGALQKLLQPFKYFVGVNLGNGRQWMSWIHIDDVVNAIRHIIINESRGIFNLTAPKPAQMREITRIAGRILRRPFIVNVPAIFIELALGERASILLESKRILPKRLLNTGFHFKFPDIDKALFDIIHYSNKQKKLNNNFYETKESVIRQD